MADELKLESLSLNAIADKSPVVREALKTLNRLQTENVSLQGQSTAAVSTKNKELEGKVAELATKNAELVKSIESFNAERKAAEDLARNDIVKDLTSTLGSNADEYKDFPLATLKAIHKNALKAVEIGMQHAKNDVAGAVAPAQPEPLSAANPPHGSEVAEPDAEADEKKVEAQNPAQPTVAPDFRGASKNARKLLGNAKPAPVTKNVAQEPQLSMYERLAKNQQIEIAGGKGSAAIVRALADVLKGGA